MSVGTTDRRLRSHVRMFAVRYIYRHRNLIERCWARLKERRAIATRYDKTALSYAAGIAIAATLDWIKSSL